MNSGDSSAKPAANLDRIVLPQEQHFGALSLLVVALLLLSDLAIVFIWKSESDTRIVVLVGLCFGQAGAAAVWALSKSIRRRGVAVLAAFAISVLMGLLFAVGIHGNGNADEMATVVVMFLGYSCAIMLAMFFYQIAAARWADTPTAVWQPRFAVGHLLIVMFAVAVVGLAIRLAMPNLNMLAEHETLMLVGCWAVLATAGGVLLLDHPVGGVRIGLYAAVGIGIIVILSNLSDWGVAVYATALQMAVLAVALLTPQLDRHQFSVTIRSRDIPSADVTLRQ